MSDERRRLPWHASATLIVWPPEHPAAPFSGDLASCVRRALEIAEGDPPPGHVEILAEGRKDIIELEEIRQMASDPTFPPAPETIEPENLQFAPMS